MSNLPVGSILLFSDIRGTNIPYDFANFLAPDCLENVDPEDIAILKCGSEHEHYWDAWDSVTRCAVVIDPETNTRYHVYQDGDCWLVPVDAEWND